MSIWRTLFGVSQAEAWTALAEQVGGTFTPDRWTASASVQARFGGHDIVLDTETVSTGNTTAIYTRLRAPFVNGDGLRLSIARASIFSPLVTALGRQDVEIGEPAFDRDFIIGTNDPERTRALLADASLRTLIMAQPHARIEIVDDEGVFGPKYGADVDVLRFTEGTLIKDIRRLAGLFSLFAGLLHALQRQSAGAGPRTLVDVPAADVPAAFLHMLDGVIGALGGKAERVGDTFEARVPGPLGLVTGGRFVLAVPALPALATSLHVDAELPPSGDTFSARGRGLQALVERGDRASRALALLAPFRPEVDAGPERLRVDVKALPVQEAAPALGAALDLWQELCRARAGLL